MTITQDVASTCGCGLYIHPSRRNMAAIHIPDCPYFVAPTPKTEHAPCCPDEAAADHKRACVLCHAMWPCPEAR